MKDELNKSGREIRSELTEQMKCVIREALLGGEIESNDAWMLFIDRHRDLLYSYGEPLIEAHGRQMLRELMKSIADAPSEPIQGTLFQDMRELPSCLTWKKKSGRIGYVERRLACRVHWLGQITYLNELIDADMRKRDQIIAANERLELLRQQHGDMPEAKLIAAAARAAAAVETAKAKAAAKAAKAANAARAKAARRPTKPPVNPSSLGNHHA